MSDKVAMLVRIELKPDRTDDLLKIFDEWFQQFEREPGTDLYFLNRDRDNPNVFWYFEVYTDDGAVKDHLSGDVLKRTLPGYRPLVADQQVTYLSPLRAKGAAL